MQEQTLGAEHQLQVLLPDLGQLADRNDVQVLERGKDARLREPAQPRQGRNGEGSEERLLRPRQDLTQL